MDATETAAAAPGPPAADAAAPLMHAAAPLMMLAAGPDYWKVGWLGQALSLARSPPR